MRFKDKNGLKLSLTQFESNQNEESMRLKNFCVSREAFVKEFRRCFIPGNISSSSLNTSNELSSSNSIQFNMTDDEECEEVILPKKRKLEAADVPSLAKPPRQGATFVQEDCKEPETSSSFYQRLLIDEKFIESKKTDIT